MVSPGTRARRREAAGTAVIVGQAVDVVLEGVQAGGGDDTRLPHAAAEELAPRCARAIMAALPSSTEPTGAPRPFDRQTVTESYGATMSRSATPEATAHCTSGRRPGAGSSRGGRRTRAAATTWSSG